MNLTDDQWNLIETYFPPPSPALRGRPPIDERAVLDGIFWKIREMEPWYDLPGDYPSWQTCYRRYHRWLRTGLFNTVLRVLREDLEDRGELDLDLMLEDGFIPPRAHFPRWRFRFHPYLDGTWQLATVRIFLGLLVALLIEQGVIQRGRFGPMKSDDPHVLVI